MLSRKAAFLLLVVLFLGIVASSEAVVGENEYLTWDYTEGGINIQCYAPMEAYAGDTLTIRLRIEVFETITDFDLWMSIFGTIGFNETVKDYGLWQSDYFGLYFKELSSGVIRVEEFEIEVPSNVQPGMVWGWFSIWWCDKYGGWWHLPYYGSVAFTVTYLRSEAYESLQKAYDELLTKYDELLADYDDLNSSYHSLLGEYDELVDEHGELSSEYNTLMENYERLQNTHDVLLTDFTELEANYGSLNSNHEELETNYTTLQESCVFLTESYDSLNSTYQSLKSDYDSLKTTHDADISALDTSKNLNYVLAVATIVFIATTIIVFARRKPKTET